MVNFLTSDRLNTTIDVPNKGTEQAWSWASCHHHHHYTRQVEQKPGGRGRGRGREWTTLRLHPLSWLLSNNRLEKVPFVSVPHTSSNRLLLSNQDKGCTPSVAHSLPLPLGPALLNLWNILTWLIHTLAFSNVLLVLALNLMVHKSSYCKCSLAWCEVRTFLLFTIWTHPLQERECPLRYAGTTALKKSHYNSVAVKSIRLVLFLYTIINSYLWWQKTKQNKTKQKQKQKQTNKNKQKIRMGTS